MAADGSRTLSAGWALHLAAVLLLGFHQQGYRDFLDTVFNTPLLWHVHSAQSVLADRVMLGASTLGRGNATATGFVLLAAGLAWRGRRRALMQVAAIVVGTAALAGMGKVIVHTTRPHLWPALEHASGSSFPSSHASASLSLAIAIFVVLPLAWRIRLGVPLFVVAFVVGLSRVYLGVHAPTDILLTWLWVVSWAVWVQARFAPPHGPSSR